MPQSVSRPLVALAFPFVLALIGACGGTKEEAKAPTTEAAETPRDGSSAPDQATAAALPAPAEGTKSEPVKTSAVSNTADGSDIVPPFTASKEPDKKAAPTKTAKTAKKKGQGKPKPKT